MWFQLVLAVTFLVFNVNAQTLGGFCRTPLNEAGKCISVWQCKTLLPLIRAPSRTALQRQFLQSSGCGFHSNGTPYVCCGADVIEPSTTTVEPPYIPNWLIPDKNNCGFQFANNIFVGEATGFDEFPWMAVLQYMELSGEKKILCGGSLINSRYILTAAHCVTGNLSKVGRLINIRLGEYDTSSPGKDCATIKGIRYCNGQEVNVGIAEVIPHPNYTRGDSRIHDIALVRLAIDVQYSEFIQPICLPQPNEASSPGTNAIVAGWGITQKGRNSNVKLKSEVPITTESRCAEAFRSMNLRIESTYICAGGLTETCSGDSGSPLMRTLPTDDSRWMLEGLVSFGYNLCGISGYPGVYTRISKYIPWIHKTVRA